MHFFEYSEAMIHNINGVENNGSVMFNTTKRSVNSIYGINCFVCPRFIILQINGYITSPMPTIPMVKQIVMKPFEFPLPSP